jgi:hypothetical protein
MFANFQMYSLFAYGACVASEIQGGVWSGDCFFNFLVLHLWLKHPKKDFSIEQQ